MTSHVLPGPGGLPVGTSGHVVALISGGFDSPVAAYRMMKRGCALTFVHFHAYPFVRSMSIEKVIEIVQALGRNQPPVRLITVPIGDLQREIAIACEPEMRVVLYRRLMLADRRGHRPGVQGRRVGDRREPGTGGVADAREHSNHRVGGDFAGLPATDRHGQGRDHRAGRADRDRRRSPAHRTTTVVPYSCPSIRRPTPRSKRPNARSVRSTSMRWSPQA